MALALRDGDYIARDGKLLEVTGQEVLLQRVLYKLTAHRGAFPFLPELGSRLWELGRVPAAARKSAAEQYVTEALAGEDLTVESVTLTPVDESTMAVTVDLSRNDTRLSVTLQVS